MYGSCEYSDSDEAKEAVRNLLLSESPNLYQKPRRKRRLIANISERKRVQTINDGFERLRSLLPERSYKLSKAAILKEAADYIVELKHYLMLCPPTTEDQKQDILRNLKLELQHEKAERLRLEMQNKVLRACANLPVSNYEPEENQVIETVHMPRTIQKSMESGKTSTGKSLSEKMSVENHQSCVKVDFGEPSCKTLSYDEIKIKLQCNEKCSFQESNGTLSGAEFSNSKSAKKATVSLESGSENVIIEDTEKLNYVDSHDEEIATTIDSSSKKTKVKSFSKGISTLEMQSSNGQDKCGMEQVSSFQVYSIKDNTDGYNESISSPLYVDSIYHSTTGEYQARCGIESIFEAIRQVEGDLF